MTYYGYQFRVSEMMNFLAFYNKKYLIAVTLGCMIANLFSFLDGSMSLSVEVQLVF